MANIAFYLLLVTYSVLAFDSTEIRMLEEEYGKRDPLSQLINSDYIIEQQKRGALNAPLIRFGKRSGLDDKNSAHMMHPLVRFGKRAPSPGDMAPLVRFGKRAIEGTEHLFRNGKSSVPDAAPLVRFGKRGPPPDSAPLVRFGKRSSSDNVWYLREVA